ncbi:MAG: hypothetical protein KGL39_43130 [Patescibacteria group bacterium]|nr:hypothetical protein [Patescibacteria group bacterium]
MNAIKWKCACKAHNQTIPQQGKPLVFTCGKCGKDNAKASVLSQQHPSVQF